MEQMNREAIFCDETEDYRFPCEADAGQEVVFYFRTGKDDADAVVLLEYRENEIVRERPMERTDSSDLFDFYSCRVTIMHFVYPAVARYVFIIGLA